MKQVGTLFGVKVWMTEQPLPEGFSRDAVLLFTSPEPPIVAVRPTTEEIAND